MPSISPRARSSRRASFGLSSTRRSRSAWSATACHGRVAVIRDAAACDGSCGSGAGGGVGRRHGPDGQREPERGALAGLGLDADAAAVELDDALADGQADAGAGVLVAAVQALEDLEDAVEVARLDADAVVLDGDAPAARPRLGRDLDAAGPVAGAELEGVADEVLQQLHELALVADDGGQLAEPRRQRPQV